MLHHPFRVVEDVWLLRGRLFDNYTEAYQYCRATCDHPLQDTYGEPELGVEGEDDNLEDIVVEDRSSWDELAGRRPGSQGILVDEDCLGDRPLDRAKDWISDGHIDSFELDPENYWKDLKLSYQASQAAPANTSPNTLQPS